MPFGSLLALAGPVLLGGLSGHREMADGLAASGEARFRIFTQPADENHFVDGHENTCLFRK
jgi:hypothetical protein